MKPVIRFSLFWLLLQPFCYLCAEPNHWEPLGGPFGGTVATLAVDENHPDHIYAASDLGGVFKSLDQGESWVDISGDMTRRTSISNILIDPRDANTIWVQSQGALFKTTDGGIHWIEQKVAGGLDIVMTKENPDILLTTTSSASEENRYGIYKTPDGGESWSLIEETNDRFFRSIAVHPSDHNLMLAFYGRDELGAMRSLDAGASWQDLDVSFATDATMDIAFDPDESGPIYVGSNKGILISQDRGASWKMTELSPIHGIQIDIEDSNRVYAVGGGGRILRSTDKGESWKFHSSEERSHHFYAIAQKPDDANVIYLGSRSLGFVKSLDRGETWETFNHSLVNTSIIQMEQHPEVPQTFIAASRYSLFRTENAGTSWAELTFDFYVSDFSGLLMFADQPHTLVTANRAQGIIRSTDLGDSWQVASENVPSFEDVFLFLSTKDNKTLYAALNKGIATQIYVSEDYGDNWKKHSTDDIQTRFDKVVVDPSNSDIMYAASWQGVYKSEDGGKQWTIKYDDVLQSSDFVSRISDIAIDPSRSKRLFAIRDSKLFISEDGALSWYRHPQKLNFLSFIDFDEQNPDIVYMGGGDFTVSMSKSIDGGQNWSYFNYGLEKRHVNSFMIDRFDSKNLYAGVQGAGLYKVTLTDPIIIPGNNDQPEAENHSFFAALNMYLILVVFVIPVIRIFDSKTNICVIWK